MLLRLSYLTALVMCLAFPPMVTAAPVTSKASPKKPAPKLPAVKPKPPATAAQKMTPPAPGEAVTSEIAVTNVAPTLIAWWLDPRHQPMPAATEYSVRMLPRMGLKSDGALLRAPILRARLGNDRYQLPAGIIALQAHDGFRTITVRGSAAAVAGVRVAVANLDAPLQKLELQSALVPLTLDQSKHLDQILAAAGDAAVEMSAQSTVRAYNLDLLPRARRTELLKWRPADTAWERATDNTPAFKFTAEIQPIYEPTANGDIGVTRTPAYYMALHSGLFCRPTVNIDGTITLLVGAPLQVTLLAKHAPTNRYMSYDRQIEIPSVVNGAVSATVRDGDTLLIVGHGSRSFRSGNVTFAVPRDFPLGMIPGKFEDEGAGLAFFVSVRRATR